MTSEELKLEVEKQRKRSIRISKQIDKAVEAAFYRVGQRVQIPVMDLGKIHRAGREAILAGLDVDEALKVALAPYRTGGAS